MPARDTLKPQVYPYEIPPVISPDSTTAKKLDLWDILEFLRIEALLRSPRVTQFYKENQDFFDVLKETKEIHDREPTFLSTLHMRNLALEGWLINEYEVGCGWLALRGVHHILLQETQKLPDWMSSNNSAEYLHQGYSPILDLQPLYEKEEGFSEITGFRRESALEMSLLNKEPRFLWLRVDASFAPTKTLNEFKQQLQKHHQELQAIPYYKRCVPWAYAAEYGTAISPSYPYHPTKKPPIKNVQVWLDYFRCYDLRQCKGKTYGQIAGKVYGDPKTKYDAAEKAVKRVSMLIHYAETNNWPPPPNFLNKKLPASSASR